MKVCTTYEFGNPVLSVPSSKQLSRSLPGKSSSHGSFCYPFARQHQPSAHLLEVQERPGRALTPGPTLLLLRGKRWWTSYPTPWPRWRSLPVVPVSCTQGPKFNPSEQHLRTNFEWKSSHGNLCRRDATLMFMFNAGSFFRVLCVTVLCASAQSCGDVRNLEPVNLAQVRALQLRHRARAFEVGLHAKICSLPEPSSCSVAV